MKRSHRAVHHLIWLLLIPALATLLVVAVPRGTDPSAASNGDLPGDVAAGELP
ncbi:MAG: hypothetical protein AAGC71_00045 [Pseudomonadota bacterium]